MAGPGLPETIDATYADDINDASVALHQQHHDAIHDIVNRFDKDASPSDGNVWAYDSATGLYLPRARLGGYRVTVVNVAGTYNVYRADGSLFSSGTNVKNQINAAINDVAATADGVGGGTVFLPAGVYSLGGFITMKSGVHLMGEGKSGRSGQATYNSLGTVLKSNSAGLAQVIKIPHDATDFSTECVGVKVSNLTVDGNLKQASVGIYIEQRDTNIESVTVRDCGTGIQIRDGGAGEAVAIRLRNGECWNCDYGIDVGGSCTDGSIVDYRLLGCDTRSLLIAAGGWIVSACHFTMSGTGTSVDIELTGSSPNSIVTGCYFDTAGNECIIVGGNWHMISNNFIKGGPGNTTQLVKVSAAGGKGTIANNFFSPAASTVNWVKYTNAAAPQARVCANNTGELPLGALIADSTGGELEASDDSNQFIKGNRGF